MREQREDHVLGKGRGRKGGPQTGADRRKTMDWGRVRGGPQGNRGKTKENGAGRETRE
jgi:hypothetical protein